MSSSTVAKARSLYRSLLREASYLPDEAAQSYFRRWIIHRFHAVSEREPGPEGVQKARTALNRLQRANQGEVKALVWVLENAYGRIGKRRRELIEALRAHTDEHLVPEDDAEVKRLLEKRRGGEHLGKEDKTPAVRTKLQALITSHATMAPPKTSPRTQLKKDKPELPETNLWGRSTPWKVRANKESRWWADTLDKLLPPLPRDEHERLKSLAMGTTRFPGLPKRRASPDVPPEPEVISDRQIARFLQPIEHVEKIPIEESTQIHKITARFMKRLWMRILTLCPEMIQDAKTKGWKVQWINEQTMPMSSFVAIARASDLELFEGSTENAVTGRVKKRVWRGGNLKQ